jgi:hypothetical protein
MTFRPLTDKQIFALRAVQKWAVRHTTVRIGWRTMVKYIAYDSDVTLQVRSLLARKLITYSKEHRNPVGEYIEFEILPLGVSELRKAVEIKREHDYRT